MLAELHEIDSYLTDSEDDFDDSTDEHRPTLAQKEFDNSVLRMGRSLLEAAKENLVPGTTDSPRITLRLTRLDPNEGDIDPRIAQTVRCLHDMGLDVELGERDELDIRSSLPNSIVKILRPTIRVNLDLSALIAVVSDLTHSPVPRSAEEANTRFIPSPKYVEWKKHRSSGNAKKSKEGLGVPDRPGQNTHVRALVSQVTQEMSMGLLQDMYDRLFSSSSSSVSPGDSGHCRMKRVEFWTTPEARDRCHRILSKIGGPNERRRAGALFSSSALSEAQEAYWHGSRYPPGFLPLPPIYVYPCSEPNTKLEYPLQLKDATTLPPFFKSLASTCRNILGQGTAPHPDAPPKHLVGDADEVEFPVETVTNEEIQRAVVTAANPRLTAHTVQSLLWGAELGWTTLTANKSSVKAILRDMKQTGDVGRFDPDTSQSNVGMEITKAALWLVDPRSLAEGQRADVEG